MILSIDVVLDFRLQIDHQVAATEQIEPGEGRIFDDILCGEHHHLADEFFHAVAAVLLHEELAKSFRRDILNDIGCQELESLREHHFQ